MPTRRDILVGAAGLVCAACGGGRPRGAPPAATCGVTTADVEGPYYRSGAPWRSSLVAPGAGGELLVLSGIVRGVGCGPIAGATLDVWQANQFGRYDSAGYGLRGRIDTDDAGHYTLTTIVPGRYRDSGRVRPAHIHVKVFAPGHRPLTTQLYFQGDPYADGDPHFRAARAVAVVDSGTGAKRAEFDFAIPPL